MKTKTWKLYLMIGISVFLLVCASGVNVAADPHPGGPYELSDAYVWTEGSTFKNDIDAPYYDYVYTNYGTTIYIIQNNYIDTTEYREPDMWACFLQYNDYWIPQYSLNPYDLGEVHDGKVGENSNSFTVYGNARVTYTFQVFFVEDNGLGEGYASCQSQPRVGESTLVNTIFDFMVHPGN